MEIIYAAIVALLGSAPFLLTKRIIGFFVTFAVSGILSAALFYGILPSTVWPLWGLIGAFTAVLWIIVALVDLTLKNENSYGEIQLSISIAPAIVGVLLLVISGCNGCAYFRDSEYAGMIGEVEQREWTQDVQPKDPGNVRLVPVELASYLANKQLGEAGANLGSQFHVALEYMTLQSLNGELWYVAPLDYNGFWVWQSAEYAPGYVKISATDPYRQPIVVADQKFKYTPYAFMGDDLERLLWNNGYSDIGLTDYSLELDDSGKPWWVVTTFEPTISWWGERATGVAIVDPTDGRITYHAVGAVPNWVDRVVPGKFVATYVSDNGQLHLGYWNTWFGKRDMTQPDRSPTINYGSDGEPYWVTTVVSANPNGGGTEGDGNQKHNQSMVGLFYTNTRPGKSIYYHAVGGTETAILTAVNNKVSYKNWRGAEPVLYNVHGYMASFVPLLGQHGTYQGVAIVRVDNLTVAEGRDELSALREFQQLIASTGHQVSPDKLFDLERILGRVERFAHEVTDGYTVYYIKLQSHPVIYTGGSDLSPELPLVAAGDSVSVSFVNGEQDVVPMMGFDDLNIFLQRSAEQEDLSAETQAGLNEERLGRETKTATETLKNLSPEEMRKLAKEARTKRN